MQKSEYENPRREFWEKVFENFERSGNEYGFWRKKNAIFLSYFDISGRERIDWLQKSELVMSNRIASSVFAEFLNRDICLWPENDKSTISSVARLDIWIYFTVLFICDEDEDEHVDRQKWMQKVSKGTFETSSIRSSTMAPTVSNVLFRLNDNELVMTMGTTSLDDQKFKISIRECTKVVLMPSTNR